LSERAAARGGSQPRSQQSLTAAQIQYPRPSLKQAQLEDGAEHRIVLKLAARELVGKSTGIAIGIACRIEQRVRQIQFRDLHPPLSHGEASYQRCRGPMNWMRWSWTGTLL